MIGGAKRRTRGEIQIGARIKADEILRLKNAQFIEILFPFSLIKRIDVSFIYALPAYSVYFFRAFFYAPAAPSLSFF